MPLRYPRYLCKEILEKPRFVDKYTIKDKRNPQYHVYVPDVIVKPVKMIYTSFKLKLAVLFLGLIVYIYLLIFIKTWYIKSKRMEHIMQMAMETEKLMAELQESDDDLAKRIAEIEEMFDVN